MNSIKNFLLLSGVIVTMTSLSYAMEKSGSWGNYSFEVNSRTGEITRKSGKSLNVLHASSFPDLDRQEVPEEERLSLDKVLKNKMEDLEIRLTSKDLERLEDPTIHDLLSNPDNDSDYNRFKKEYIGADQGVDVCVKFFETSLISWLRTYQNTLNKKQGCDGNPSVQEKLIMSLSEILDRINRDFKESSRNETYLDAVTKIIKELDDQQEETDALNQSYYPVDEENVYNRRSDGQQVSDELNKKLNKYFTRDPRNK